jgi:capsule polysaccharide export protein KpsE/RkpR
MLPFLNQPRAVSSSPAASSEVRHVDFSVLRNRAVLKRIAAVTLTSAALGLAYGLTAPKSYRSVLTIVPVKQQAGGLSSQLGVGLGGLAAGLDLSPGGSADVARIAAVLQSTSVTDAVIEKLDLRTRYREKFQEFARDAVWRSCSVTTLAKPSLVQLTCEDKDPRFAQQMLGCFAEHGNLAFRRVGTSSASEEVRFLERRVAELKRQAGEAATRMREFQEKHQIVDLNTQSRAVVSTLAALNTQRITKELEFDYARTFSALDEPTLEQLETQIAVVERQLQQLEGPRTDAVQGGRRPARSGAGLFPPALDVPKIRSEFEALFRDRRVAEMMLVNALKRLEGARANEARDVSTFVVLHPPTLATRHARPRRALTLFASTVLGLAGAIAIELGRLRFRSSSRFTR